jgi:hypothetical protein
MSIIIVMTFHNIKWVKKERKKRIKKKSQALGAFRFLPFFSPDDVLGLA